MKIIAIANQKGGVGKTTTSVNLSASLAALGKKILLVDLDPQGNATTGSGIEKTDLSKSVYHVLLGQATLNEVAMRSPAGDYQVLPANRELAGAEVELVDFPNREFQLRWALNNSSDVYDFVLIDCPPALNMLTVNGLAAAERVMIPMQCEYYALEGLSDLVQTIKRVRHHLNPQLEIEGLLRTMFDPRSQLAQQVSAQLEEHFGDKVYKTVIPRNIRLAEAPSHGMAAMHYEPHSKGAMAYQELAEELLMRQDAVQSPSSPEKE
jgi:chromosome partitioning protein